VAPAVKRTYSVYKKRVRREQEPKNPTGKAMFLLMRVFCAALFLAATFPMPGFAQSGDNKGDGKTSSTGPTDAKEVQRRVDEFAEASKMVSGPAGNPECVWLGRRVVGLLWRDDMDTAFRHLDLYDRFGCPGPHIQAAFRCVVRQGNIDPKSPQSLNSRVHTCWLNPASPPSPPPEASTAAAATKGSGTGGN
jgi:hypothetical protein